MVGLEAACIDADLTCIAGARTDAADDALVYVGLDGTLGAGVGREGGGDIARSEAVETPSKATTLIRVSSVRRLFTS